MSVNITSIESLSKFQKEGTDSIEQQEKKKYENLRKLSTFSGLVDDIDVEDYLKQTDEELKKIDYSLGQRMFSEAVINLLDKLMEGKKFSRIIFVYILDSAHLSRDSSIMLLDFFRAYFLLYESMKKNRLQNLQEAKELTQKIDKYKNKLNKHKTQELVLQEGLTNNSKVKFEILHINLFTVQNKNTTNYTIKISLDHENSKEVEIAEPNIRKKYILAVKSLESKLTIEICKFELEKNSNIVVEDQVPLKDIFESKMIKKIVIPSFGEIDIDMVFIQSKINYYLKIFNRFEERKTEIGQNLNTLDQSIKYFEEPFPKLFSVSIENIKNFQNELEVSEKIEHYILKIIGKNLIIWEKVFFLVNKIISFLIFFSMLYRSDFPSLIICLIIYGLEFSMVEKKYFNKVLILIVFSWIYDSTWLFYYLSKWDIATIQEIQSSGSTYRKTGIMISAMIILLKLVLLFSVWRLALTEKVKRINPSKKFIAKKQIFERFIHENLADRQSYGTNNISDS